MTIPPNQPNPPLIMDYPSNETTRISVLVWLSLILGLLSIVLFYITGLPAVVLGYIALHQINRNPNRYGGAGLAKMGIRTGLYLPLLMLLLIVMLPGRSHNHERAMRTACAANISGLLKASIVYAADNGDQFPLTVGSSSATGTNSYTVSTGAISASPFSNPKQALSTAPGGLFAAPNNNPTAVLWILVLGDSISPRSLVCHSDPYAEFKGFERESLKDRAGHYYLAPQKPSNISYSIAFPWNTKGPGAAPYWMNSGYLGTPSPLVSDMALRQAPGDNVTATGKKINSPNHNGEGQNVGFSDCHTEWIDNPNKAHPTTNESIFHYGGYDPATSTFSTAQKQSTTGITPTDPSPTTYDIYMVPQRDASGMIH